MRIVSEEVVITCNVDKGLYFFEDLYATGKTRLCQLLSKIKARGEAVDTYSYSDFEGKRPVTGIREDAQLLVVDRYDMFSGEIDVFLAEFAKSHLVVLDCKHGAVSFKAGSVGTMELRLVSAFEVELEGT